MQMVTCDTKPVSTSQLRMEKPTMSEESVTNTDDIETYSNISSQSTSPLPTPGISRRTLVIWLTGVAVTEVLASGLSWSTLLKRVKVFFPIPIPTPVDGPVGTLLYRYTGHSSSVFAVAW